MKKPFDRYALIHRLVEIASEVWEVDAGELLGRRRTRRVSEARQAVSLVATRLLNRTTVEVGKALGRDHSTISTAAKEAADRLLANPEYARRYESFCEAVEKIRPTIPYVDSLNMHEPADTVALSRLVALQRVEPRVFQVLLEIARLNTDLMDGAAVLLAQAKFHRSVIAQNEGMQA